MSTRLARIVLAAVCLSGLPAFLAFAQTETSVAYATPVGGIEVDADLPDEPFVLPEAIDEAQPVRLVRGRF